MISAAQIQDILALYKKYDWTLRRVLLSDELLTEISEQLEPLFSTEAAFVTSEIDALWFSRISIEGNETWELRHLSQTPFALVEVFDEDEDETVREERLHELESELQQKTSSKKSAERSH